MAVIDLSPSFHPWRKCPYGGPCCHWKRVSLAHHMIIRAQAVRPGNGPAWRATVDVVLAAPGCTDIHQCGGHHLETVWEALLPHTSNPESLPGDPILPALETAAWDAFMDWVTANPDTPPVSLPPVEIPGVTTTPCC